MHRDALCSATVHLECTLGNQEVTLTPFESSDLTFANLHCKVQSLRFRGRRRKKKDVI